MSSQDALSNVKVLCFDVGNTLVGFGNDQARVVDAHIKNTLRNVLNIPCSDDQYNKSWVEEIERPFQKGVDFFENSIDVNYRMMISQLCELTNIEEPVISDEELSRLCDLRRDAFSDSVAMLPETPAVLQALKDKGYILCVFSNYPCGQTVRDIITKSGTNHLFDFVIASGDFNRVKPHASVFEEVASRVKEAHGYNKSEIMYVGDTPLCDIVGPLNAGFGAACLYTRYKLYDSRDYSYLGMKNYEPTIIVENFSELLEHL
ncbi:hypothetical protein PCE1_000316 [Barthelona sp. PCE]